jgi:hypothetical protein
MRGDTKAGRFRGVEVGEFAKPVGSEIRKHDEKVAVRRMMRDVAVVSIVDIFLKLMNREGAKV